MVQYASIRPTHGRHSLTGDNYGYAVLRSYLTQIPDMTAGIRCLMIFGADTEPAQSE